MAGFFKSFSARLSVRFMFIMTVAVVVLCFLIFSFIRSLVYQNQANVLKFSEDKIYEVFEDYTEKNKKHSDSQKHDNKKSK